MTASHDFKSHLFGEELFSTFQFRWIAGEKKLLFHRKVHKNLIAYMKFRRTCFVGNLVSSSEQIMNCTVATSDSIVLEKRKLRYT